jgi:hypothetical protein
MLNILDRVPIYLDQGQGAEVRGYHNERRASWLRQARVRQAREERGQAPSESTL